MVGESFADYVNETQGFGLTHTTVLFAAALAAVFATWYAREHTLSIHSIVTTPREGFYWLTVLVTFALGTALGDWTLELTGWSPGVAVLLPAGLLVVVRSVAVGDARHQRPVPGHYHCRGSLPDDEPGRPHRGRRSGCRQVGSPSIDVIGRLQPLSTTRLRSRHV